MALEKYISTQTAILIAGGLIAAGLFFGLRRQEAPSPPAPSVAGPPVPAGPPAALHTGSVQSASPVLAPPAQAGPASEAVVTSATAAAQKALEAHRADIVEKCVTPSIAKKPDPPRVKYSFNVTFDPQGKQIARGMEEDRAMFRADVGVCLASALPPLQIPPPGVAVKVDVDWILP